MAEPVTVQMIKRGKLYCNMLLEDEEIRREIYYLSINPMFLLKHAFDILGIKYDLMLGSFESEIKLFGNQSLEQISGLRGLIVNNASRESIHDIAVETLRLRSSANLQPYHSTIENLFFEGAIIESDKLAIRNIEHAVLPSAGKGYSVKVLRQ